MLPSIATSFEKKIALAATSFDEAKKEQEREEEREGERESVRGWGSVRKPL